MQSRVFISALGLLTLILFPLASCANDNVKKRENIYRVAKAKIAPKIDGLSDEAVWQKAEWKAIDKLILGPPVSSEDFSGRYKLLWSEAHLYLLVEMLDDELSDKYADPLERYWDDDALEIFIDEDASGGVHQFNYNAFAYHIALDNQAIDIGPFLSEEDKKAGKANVRAYPQHIRSQWRRSLEEPHKIIWEVAISVFNDRFKDTYAKGEKVVRPEKLHHGKKMGFMLAYCDSDTSDSRENFIGDVDVEAVNGDKNRGYIDASVFGTIILDK